MKVGEGMLPKKASESMGEALRRTAIFAQMSEETEKTLSALGETVFSAGDMIVDAEDFDSFRGLGVMLAGKASVYGKGNDRHVLLNRLGPSDIFGAATVFFSEREAVSTVSAQTKCRILFIERSVLEKVMKNDFAVSSAYIAFLSERICFLNRKITGFTAKSADAALAGYLILKGAVVGRAAPACFTYGETVSWDARAILGEVRYEYREAGSDEWREGVPRLAGRYEVRAASVNAFGKDRFGKVCALEILPRELTLRVTDTEAVYGSAIAVSGEPIEGDTLDCFGFLFRRLSDFTSGDTRALYEVTPDLGRIRVLDENGEDVTGGYRIETVSARVTVAKLDLTLTVPDAEKIYDGEALRSLAFEITEGSLCEGDTAKGGFSASQTAVGTTVNETEFRVYDAAGRDVTELYRIKAVYGSLCVKPRLVTVTTGSAE